MFSMNKALIVIVIIAVIGFAVIFWAFNFNTPPTPDAVFINDAVMNFTQNESIDYLTEELNQVFKDMDSARNNRDRNLQIFLYIFIGAVVLAGAGLYIYCERNILKPFRKLQSFAKRIAAGNLDVPLEMDRNNLFGAFTESFDLMREELNKARENELKADRSKKELVASLSHDIKTPVASIKAVTELMLVTVKDEREKKHLETISVKAEQINSLITNMFHATLEELHELNVNVAEVHSTLIPDLIKSADYLNRAGDFTVPSCIVLTDPLRLQQIFDNIIGNSYKYAGTDIQIRADFDEAERYVIIDIMDFGTGVPQEELPFLAGKFYRGKNSAAKSGYGLGLYISKYLMEQMSGELKFDNRADGFTVRIMLRLA